MFVILETGGKQYRVQQGETVRIERLEGDEGSQIVIDSVLAAETEAGFRVGRPKLEGARVVGTILKQGRARKVLIYKFKRRKGYRRTKGHRQEFTDLRIDEVALS